MNTARKIRPNLQYITKQRNPNLVNQVSKETILLRSLLQKNREFFNSGKTRDIGFRIEQLRKLRGAVVSNKGRIVKALWDDMKKPAYEVYSSEIGITLKEIDFALANVKNWARERKVGTPRVYSPAKSFIVPEPYGTVLIIGPWNFPFQLVMAPLAGAIAAGNTAVIKPSRLAPNTAGVVAGIIGEAFGDYGNEYVSVVQGSHETTRELLNERFDHIFFTGGAETGRLIMRAAAEHLTPVTLELGGKSPVIVDRNSNLDMAAKKIVWGKFMNAGQACLAPDYLLVHRDVKNELLERIRYYVHDFYGENPRISKSYGRIINEEHFRRLARLLRSGSKFIGGRADCPDLYIEPTVVDGVTLNHPLMKEEIFGPILPVMTYRNLEEAVAVVKALPKALALYIFSRNAKTVDYLINNTSSGGVNVNEVMVHLGNYNLPFGGVGESGMGAYHGKAGFEAFSHMKSVMKRSRFGGVSLRYPPYNKAGKNILRRLFG